MKKNILSLFVLSVMTLASCTAQKSKVLVAYFSATGTTRSLAQELATNIEANLFEIEAAQPYTEADVSYMNRESRAVKEMADKSIRPEIKSKVEKINRYETIYIGFPVWGDAAPNIIYSFIEQNNLKGKRVIVFSTSGSGDLKNSARLLREAYPDLNWVEGVTLKRNPTPEDRANVLSKLKELLSSK